MEKPQRGVICPGCPHRAAYVVVKEAMGRGRGHVICGDAGCRVVGAVHPAASACPGGQAALLPRYNQAAPVGSAAEPGSERCAHFVLDADLMAERADRFSRERLAAEGTAALLCVMTSSAHYLAESGADELVEQLRTLGYEEVAAVDPFDTQGATEAARDLLAARGARAVVFASPCAQLMGRSPLAPAAVDRLSCVGCMRCVQITGCPALRFAPPAAAIDPEACAGCDLCADFCRTHVIYSPRTGQPLERRRRERFEAAGVGASMSVGSGTDTVTGAAAEAAHA
ncbi:MAG: hypothetical protein SOY67_06150 [Collinsella sp.]|nr:hypothetical protein [Collinsella sp.]